MKYEFKTKPFQHQIEDCRLLWKHKVFANLSEMGTGKSKSIVDTACALFERGKDYHDWINTVLIVCPNTVRAVWADEFNGQIAIHMPDRLGAWVINEKPVKSYIDQRILDLDGLLWIVINYEQFRNEENCELILELMRYRPTMMVLDESTSIKTLNAKQTKGVHKVAPYAERRYILTGTPISRNPLDFYSQFYFLDPLILGYKTFNQMMIDVVESSFDINHMKIAKKFRNLDLLHAKIAPYSIRHLKKDCTDIPEKQYITLPILLSDEQQRYYKQMKKHSLITISEFESEHPTTSSAPIILTQMLRLQQISSGFVVTESSEYFHSDNNPKADTVINICKEKDKVIVFCRFKEEISILIERFVEEKIEYREISGRITEDNRAEAQYAFQTGTARVILCQTETGGIGITLTAADTVIYMSNTFSLKDRLQSEDRAHRVGQNKQVTYYDMIATLDDKSQTIDSYILEAIKSKAEISNYLLQNLKGQL